MAHYCRYCAFCISGDSYYCSSRDKILNRIDAAVRCKDFEFSALGDVDTGKEYVPRKKAQDNSETDWDQMKLI